MKIQDVIIKDNEWQNDIVQILNETEPFLRRFGQCDFVAIAPGESVEFLRQKADEAWTVLYEKANFILEDTRPDSPSYQVREGIELYADTAQTILIPFGVSCTILTEEWHNSHLLRLTTHQDDTHPGDKTISKQSKN
jgi:hypothetical protein